MTQDPKVQALIDAVKDYRMKLEAGCIASFKPVQDAVDAFESEEKMEFVLPEWEVYYDANCCFTVLEAGKSAYNQIRHLTRRPVKKGREWWLWNGLVFDTLEQAIEHAVTVRSNAFLAARSIPIQHAREVLK